MPLPLKTPIEEMCLVCGLPFLRYYAGRRDRCNDCGIRMVTDNASQLHNKSGPQYTKWLAAMQRAMGAQMN